jgi:serine/threonine protein kinase
VSNIWSRNWREGINRDLSAICKLARAGHLITSGQRTPPLNLTSLHFTSKIQSSMPSSAAWGLAWRRASAGGGALGAAVLAGCCLAPAGGDAGDGAGGGGARGGGVAFCSSADAPSVPTPGTERRARATSSKATNTTTTTSTTSSTQHSWLPRTMTAKELEKYDLQGNLGHGFKTVVNRMRNRDTGEAYAVKVIPHDIGEESVLREVEMLRAAGRHRSIVRLEGAYKTPEGYLLFLELARGGELFERILARRGSSFPEGQAARIMAEVLIAVAHLHKRGIVHMDLKPENIVLRSADDLETERVLLTDFGSAWRPTASDLVSAPLQTTSAYAAPEVLSAHCNVDDKADVWALGVIMYILLVGRHPFPARLRSRKDQCCEGEEGEDEEGSDPHRITPNFKAKEMRHVSPAAKDLLRRMLAHDPRDRPSAVEALQHVWFDPVIPLDENV